MKFKVGLPGFWVVVRLEDESLIDPVTGQGYVDERRVWAYPLLLRIRIGLKRLNMKIRHRKLSKVFKRLGA